MSHGSSHGEARDGGEAPARGGRPVARDLWLATGLGAALLVVYLWAAFALSAGVDVRRFSSGIYDMDVARVVSDLTSPRPGLRTSVHPLQKLLVAPVGESLNALLFAGRDRLGAARVLVALATVLQVLAAGALAWQLTAGSRPAAWVTIALAGASFSSLLAASVPESAALAAITSLLPLLLLGARRKCVFSWGEACAWALLGVLALGLTLTQLGPWAIALCVRVGPARAREQRPRTLLPRVAVALAGAVVLVVAGAALQARVYPGTEAFRHLNPVEGERPYLRLDDAWASPLRHGAVLLAHFAVIDFVAPFPAYSDFLIRGGQDYWSLSAEEASWRDWAPAQLALAACVAIAVAAAASRAPRSDPRLLAPVLVLGWHFVLHLLYGREYVLYSPHWHGLLVAVVVSGLWNGLPGWRRRLPWAAAALAAGLLVNGAAVLQAVYREVDAGLEASRRDEAGRLRTR